MRKKGEINRISIELADRIEQQIRRADMAPGTAFQQTAEIAKEHGVSTSCANMAMRLLVHRGMVERQRCSGTIIADYRTLSRSFVGAIYLMMPDAGFSLPPERLQDLILGVQSVLPSANIKFIYYEQTGGNSKIGELVRGEANQSIILVRAPLALQRLVCATGLPCVMLGHPFPTISLPWVDVDSTRQGELAADCVLELSGASALLLMQNRIAPGDHLFMNGFKKELLSAEWDLSRLTEYFIPSDAEVVKHMVQKYLRGHQTACSIIVPVGAANHVFEAVKKSKAKTRVSVVGIRGINCELEPTAEYTVIDWEIDLFGLGAKLGRHLLRRVESGKTFQEKSVFSPTIVHE